MTEENKNLKRILFVREYPHTKQLKYFYADFKSDSTTSEITENIATVKLFSKWQRKNHFGWDSYFLIFKFHKNDVLFGEFTPSDLQEEMGVFGSSESVFHLSRRVFELVCKVYDDYLKTLGE